MNYKHLIAYLGEQRNKQYQSDLATRFFAPGFIRNKQGAVAWNLDGFKALHDPNIIVDYRKRKVFFKDACGAGIHGNVNTDGIWIMMDARNPGPFTYTPHDSLVVWDREKKVIMLTSQFKSLEEVGIKRLAEAIDAKL